MIEPQYQILYLGVFLIGILLGIFLGYVAGKRDVELALNKTGYKIIWRKRKQENKMSKRKDGFYWIKTFDNRWEPAEWSQGVWWAIGDEDYLYDSDFKEIGEEIIREK